MSASLLLYPRKMALTRGIVPHTRANSYQSPVNHSGILSMDTDRSDAGCSRNPLIANAKPPTLDPRVH
jgi:hypothetical protein